MVAMLENGKIRAFHWMNLSVRRPEADRVDGYDLWANLSSLSADITFGQLLEISPMAQQTLKEGMPVTRRTRKPKTRVSIRIQLRGKNREVKALEIEVMVVDKMVMNVLVDGGNGLNILPEHTMMKLGLSLTGPSPFVINMANQNPAVPLGMIKDCRLSAGGEEYIVILHVIKMHNNKDNFPILLRKPWLRMANTIVDWGGIKASMTSGPKDNRVKVSIGSSSGWIREEVDQSSEKEEYKDGEKFDDSLVGVVQLNSEKSRINSWLCFLGPSFYNQTDDGEFAH